MRGGLVTILAVALACFAVACGDDDASGGKDGAKAKPSPVADGGDRAKPTPSAAEDRAKPEPSAAEGTGDGVTPPGGPRKMLGDFGRPPTTAERAAILAAIDRYHRAVAANDDVRICAQMSRAGKRAVSRNAGGSGRCPDQIDPFYSGYSDAMREAMPHARMTELRVKGDHAIAIGFIPGPRTIKLPMDRERGTWRYGTFGKWTPAGL